MNGFKVLGAIGLIFTCSVTAFAQKPKPGFGDFGLELMSVAPALKTTWQKNLEHGDFFQLSRDIASETDRTLRSCGLFFMTTYPNVPGDFAIVNRFHRLLAIYDYHNADAMDYHVYANPNGTYQHRIRASADDLRISNPYEGLMARARKTTTDGVESTTYTCDGDVVDVNGFVSCVNQHYISLIARQLCRFSN